ncbi:MAG: hypothetical protein Q8O00_02475, partial [Holophaga sp.]|nr:hypothetical protein [Holophaga sp.]
MSAETPSGESKSISKPPPEKRWQRFFKVCRTHHRKTTLLLVILLFALALAFTDALLAGPMKTWAERTINSNLQGYTVRIGGVRPHVWRLAFELENLVLVQNTHPEPAVADFRAMKFSLVWSELLHFRVAGELTIDRPALHINLMQIQEEVTGQVRLKDRGWQNAVESIYPIKLDRVRIQDGSLLYLSSGTISKPLHLTKVNMVTTNVRNIASAQGTY